MSDSEVIRMAIYDMQADFIPWGCDFGWEKLSIHAVLEQVAEFQDVDESLIDEVLEELGINGTKLANSLYFNQI